MRKNILIVFCTALVMCFSGCVVVNFSEGGAVSGKGEPERFEISVGGYNGIKVETGCEIQYYAEPSNTVVLEIQPNLRGYFVVEVKDGELIVRSTKKINFYPNKSLTLPVLRISTPVLYSLTVTGICTFKANDTITADHFNLEISGAGNGKAEFDVNSLKANMEGTGNFELSGKADIAEINLSGIGELNAFSLQTREASVALEGTGTIRINSSEKLRVNANGIGAVEYKGYPNLSLNTNGLVNIREAN